MGKEKDLEEWARENYDFLKGKHTPEENKAIGETVLKKLTEEANFFDLPPEDVAEVYTKLSNHYEEISQREEGAKMFYKIFGEWLIFFVEKEFLYKELERVRELATDSNGIARDAQRLTDRAMEQTDILLKRLDEIEQVRAEALRMFLNSQKFN